MSIGWQNLVQEIGGENQRVTGTFQLEHSKKLLKKNSPVLGHLHHLVHLLPEQTSDVANVYYFSLYLINKFLSLASCVFEITIDFPNKVKNPQ